MWSPNDISLVKKQSFVLHFNHSKKKTHDLFSACLTVMDTVSHKNPRMQLLFMKSPGFCVLSFFLFFFTANVLKMKKCSPSSVRGRRWLWGWKAAKRRWTGWMDETKLSFTPRASCFHTNVLFCTDAQGVFNKKLFIHLWFSFLYIFAFKKVQMF